jgi:protein-S-isoprenylcysteine O-methyltransferase Ste14
MDLGINLNNLWIFYAIAYAIAFPLRTWANAKRGEPIEDPELLAERKIVLVAALTWILSGFVISLFVPLSSGLLFYIGVLFYVFGIIIAAGALYSLAHNRGLVTSGFYRFSRNPNYVGWTLAIFGMSLMGWSNSLPGILFLVYFLVTIPYFHWTVLVEEDYLVSKHGASYREFLELTPRYIGFPGG